jgi:hypothetical protein
VKRIRYNTIVRYKIKPYIYIDPGKDLKWLWKEKEKLPVLSRRSLVQKQVGKVIFVPRTLPFAAAFDSSLYHRGGHGGSGGLRRGTSAKWSMSPPRKSSCERLSCLGCQQQKIEYMSIIMLFSQSDLTM